MFAADLLPQVNRSYGPGVVKCSLFEKNPAASKAKYSDLLSRMFAIYIEANPDGSKVTHLEFKHLFGHELMVPARISLPGVEWRLETGDVKDSEGNTYRTEVAATPGANFVQRIKVQTMQSNEWYIDIKYVQGQQVELTFIHDGTEPRTAKVSFCDSYFYW